MKYRHRSVWKKNKTSASAEQLWIHSKLCSEALNLQSLRCQCLWPTWSFVWNAGTDEEAIIYLVSTRNNSQRHEIFKMYKTMFGRVSQTACRLICAVFLSEPSLPVARVFIKTPTKTWREHCLKGRAFCVSDWRSRYPCLFSVCRIWSTTYEATPAVTWNPPWSHCFNHRLISTLIASRELWRSENPALFCCRICWAKRTKLNHSCKKKKDKK